MDVLCDAEYFSNWSVEYTERTGSTYVSILHVHYAMHVRKAGGVPLRVQDFGRLLKFFGVQQAQRTKHGQPVQMVLKKTPLQERIEAQRAYEAEQAAIKASKRTKKLFRGE